MDIKKKDQNVSDIKSSLTNQNFGTSYAGHGNHGMSLTYKDDWVSDISDFMSVFNYFEYGNETVGA